MESNEKTIKPYFSHFPYSSKNNSKFNPKFQSFEKKSFFNNNAAKVKISGESYMCRLCRPYVESGQNIKHHSINECLKFPSTKDKLSRLKFLGYCTRCTSQNCNSIGKMEECRVKLRNKCSCGDDHVYFLCNKREDRRGLQHSKITFKNERKNNSDTNKTNYSNKCSKLNNFAINMGTKMAPPMVSLPCLQKGKGLFYVPAILDTASQGTFISPEALKHLNYVFVKNNNVEVSGINNNKLYKTKDVLIKFIIDNEIRPIYATVLPNVTSDYYLPGLSSIFSEFSKKNYFVACPKSKNDKYRIEMIIGINAFDQFYLKFKKFGNSHIEKSTFIQCNLGTVPMGNMIKMKNNLQYLSTSKFKNKKFLGKFNLKNLKDCCDFDLFEP